MHLTLSPQTLITSSQLLRLVTAFEEFHSAAPIFSTLILKRTTSRTSAYSAQIEFCSTLVLNKTDLVAMSSSTSSRRLCADFRKDAVIVRAVNEQHSNERAYQYGPIYRRGQSLRLRCLDGCNGHLRARGRGFRYEITTLVYRQPSAHLTWTSPTSLWLAGQEYHPCQRVAFGFIRRDEATC